MSVFCSAERKAQRRLSQALTKTQREQYLLNDAVLERGRSGVIYMVRKNRPTVAFREDSEAEGGARALCALCLHPWAYYKGSWAGAMPPSDEVLAHLLYIRSNEHYFWRKANQIPLHEPASGI